MSAACAEGSTPVPNGQHQNTSDSISPVSAARARVVGALFRQRAYGPFGMLHHRELTERLLAASAA
jgi:hypothetical protein